MDRRLFLNAVAKSLCATFTLPVDLSAVRQTCI